MGTNIPETEARTAVETVPTGAVRETMAIPAMAIDRTRWGPIWAGMLVTFSIFLVLEALLFWAGGLALRTSAGGIVVNHPWITWVLALVAFFVGGVTTSSTSAIRGVGVGMLNGLILWALATTLFAAVSFFGAGVAAGTIGALVSRFLSLSTLQHAATLAPTAVSDLRTAAGWALLTLVTTALAAMVGGSLASFGRPPGRIARER